MDLEPSHPADTTIAEAFDPESFRKLGHAVVDQLADALQKTQQGDGPVRDPQTPEQALQTWKNAFPDGINPENAEALVEKAISHAFRCHHPQNLGHQVGPALPLAAIIDLVGSFLDTGNGVFEVGNPATPMEHIVLKDLAARAGLPPETDGVLTSGGSLGNLTALLAMRQCQTENWDSGSSDQPCAVIVSEEAHYCVTRSAKIMGWGEPGVITVPVDAEYRMQTDALLSIYENATSRGIRVLGVVGSAGSTATGRIDPLSSIADFCQTHQLWFHVDAAHAGAFVFSKNARSLLQGIEYADSVVIDFHKMLLSPSLLTAVLFRRPQDSFQTFAQRADYLWKQDESTEWWDAAKRTLECTRPMLGLRAYALLKAGGQGLFESYIDRALAMTHTFASLIKAADDFELLIEPESNIICYRYSPKGYDPNQLSNLNQAIRSQLIEIGDFYIVQVDKYGETYLRSALMNPFVSRPQLEGLLDHIRSLA